MTEHYPENRPDPTGEAIRKILDDAAWIERVDPDYYANEKAVSTEELKKQLGIINEENK